MKATGKVEKFYELVKEMQDFFQTQAEKKQERYDNASNAWQEGEKGGDCLEEIQNIEDLANEIDDVVMALENTYEL